MFFKRKLTPFHKIEFDEKQTADQISYDSYRPQAISPTSNKFYEYLQKAEKLNQE